MTELAIIEFEQPLAKAVEGIAEAERISETFAPHFRALRAELSVAMAVQPDQPGKARAVRLVLKNIRVASEKDRKNLKENSLRTGKAIDGVHALLEKMLIPAEEAMREVEEAEERREAARKLALVNERAALLAPFCDPRHFALAEMAPEQFASLLAGQTAAHEASVAAAAKAKADAKQAERDKAATEERERAERNRLWLEGKAAREALAAEQQKVAAAAAEAQLQIDAANAETARLRREQETRDQAERDRMAAEQRRIAAEAEAEQRRAAVAAAAPDAEKLGDWMLAVAAVPRPEMQTDAGRIAISAIMLRFDRLFEQSMDLIDGMKE